MCRKSPNVLYVVSYYGMREALMLFYLDTRHLWRRLRSAPSNYPTLFYKDCFQGRIHRDLSWRYLAMAIENNVTSGCWLSTYVHWKWYYS
jgi:hypothetical protein